jgi:hypothetical protein
MPDTFSEIDRILDAKLSGGAKPGVAVPDEPAGPYADNDKIVKRIKKMVDEGDKLRWAFERLWFRSILFYLGNQWIIWDVRSRRWREKKLRKWIPRPVSNRYASTVDTIVSTIQGFKVQPSAWPATDDSQDIAAADVADKLIPVIEREIEIESVREAAAKWMGLNADAFVLPYYDKSDTTLGKTQVQHVKCDICGATDLPAKFETGCPTCGSTEGLISPAEGTFTEYPVGKLMCDVYSPLEVYLNLDVPQMSRQDRWAAFRSYSIDTIKATWGDRAKGVEPDQESATKTAKYFMEAISYSTEDAGYNLTGAALRDRATIFRFFEMPSEDFPEGLWATMASNETMLESGPSPFFEVKEDGSKEFYNPLVKVPYQFVPGRLYAKTPAYDLINKQEQLNRLESLIELASMKGTYGTWLLPAGSSISQVTGEPAQKIHWTPTGTGGAEPKVVTTAPFPAILLEWRKQIHEDFEEIAGTFDAMKGQVPRGVSAGYAIQLLTERSYGRFQSVFAAWEQAWTKIYINLLKLFRTYATEERLLKIKGDTGQWEVHHFKGADLTGSVDLRIEGGTSRPRSKIAEQALVESLSKLGVLTPAQDPEQKYQIAKTFGVGYMLGAQDDDQRHAAREWEEFKAWDGQPYDVEGNKLGPAVNLAVDNHMVHISDHRKRAKSDVFRQQPKNKQITWEQHIIDHMTQLMPMLNQQPGNGNAPPKPATSKANETDDKTMDKVREGGNATLGAGGKNQYPTPQTPQGGPPNA